MSEEPIVYLLINGGKLWSNDIKGGMLRVIAPNETEPVVKRFSELFKFDSSPWTIPEKSKLLLVYDEEPIRDSTISPEETNERYTKCRKTLHAVLPKNRKVRVFYHRGEDFKTLKEIQEHFTANFWDCPDVMPHSKTNIGFPWIAQINDARAAYLQNKDSSETLLKRFDSAWYTVFTYFHIEQPTRVAIESLFPLFVDLSNHEISPLSELECNAACSAAMKGLETNLAEIIAADKHSAIDFFKQCFESIKNSQMSGMEKEKTCAEASLELFKLLPNLTSDGHGIFKENFKALSKAYSLLLGLGPVAPPTIPTASATS